MAANTNHILLIDDDPVIHDAVKLILEPEGFRVACCLTGRQGMEALQREAPDLILLDVMLATPSEGFDLVYEIRNQTGLEDTPIIILSAVGRSAGVDFARRSGTEFLPVQHFLEKPFTPDALRSVVGGAVHKKGTTQ